MFDELDLLRDRSDLQRLLSHYAEAGEADREAWQDRLMALEGVETSELVKLHGLLIAFGWLDQNTGNIPVLRAGTVPGCYRVTAAGLRADRVVRRILVPSEAEMAAEAETAKPQPRKAKPPKTKKVKSAEAESPVMAAVESDESLAATIA